MWGKVEGSKLLVGTLGNTAAMENSLGVSQKVDTATIWLSTPMPRVISTRIEIRDPNRYFYAPVK